MFIVFVIFIHNLLACEIKNITGADFAKQRQDLYSSSEQGVRIAYGGLKSANSNFGLGAVNATMNIFEKDLCSHLPKGSEVYKTDFKGYFVKCNDCTQVNEVVRVIKPGLLPDGVTRLTTTSVEAPSFKEGYVRARVINEYGDVGANLSQFINDEFKTAIDDMRPEMISPDFEKEFSKAIEKYRKGGDFNMDLKMERLIKALDVLGEVPFANSNNIDEELMAALNSNEKISSAQTGDDLFIVIKENGQVNKVIGADARGLGVLNISSRLEVIANSIAQGEEISSIDKLYELSLKSIERADNLMEASMQRYDEIIRAEILSNPNLNIETNIANAHQKYTQLALDDPDLMEMRAAALSNCGADHQKIMNRITAIHNRIKLMEAQGVQGYFGASCLGAQYWLLKHGFE